MQLQKNGMSHGVMVALQILVLPVQVRALVGQQKPLFFKSGFLFLAKELIEMICERESVNCNLESDAECRMG